MTDAAPTSPSHWGALGLALFVASGALLLKVFHWEAMVFLPFVVDLLSIGLAIAWVVALVLSFKRLARRDAPGGAAAWLPLLINFAVVVALFVPTEGFRIERNFQSNLARRNQIVALVQAGKLGPKAEGDPSEVHGSASRIALPPGYEDLAYDHRISLYPPGGPGKTQIRFQIYAGCMGDCGAAYVFVSNAEPPDTPPDYSAHMEVRKLAEHWYWVEY